MSNRWETLCDPHRVMLSQKSRRPQPLVPCSPFAAKLGIGLREASSSQGVELSRTTSLRDYGAIRHSDAADVEDRQLWSAVSDWRHII